MLWFCFAAAVSKRQLLKVFVLDWQYCLFVVIRMFVLCE